MFTYMRYLWRDHIDSKTVLKQEPGDHSLLYIKICIIYILADMCVARLGYPRREGSLARLTSNATLSRRLFAATLALLGLLGGATALYNQAEYFSLLKALNLHDLRLGGRSQQSNYVWFFEAYPDDLPQMFTLLHYREWTGEAFQLIKRPVPEWSHYLWWTQQYFSGLMCFSIFLLSQSRVRSMSKRLIFCFIWLAMTSLSFAQCLLFVYILMTPPSTNQERFDSDWLRFFVATASVAYHYFVAMLAQSLNSSRFQIHLIWILGLVLVTPVVKVVLPKTYCFRLRFISLHEAQAAAFYPFALTSLALHLYSTWLTFIAPWLHAPDAKDRLYTNALNLNSRISEGPLKALRDDPALAAIVWDVVFSFVSIVMWTVISSGSLYGMIRCTINPMVDSHQIPRAEGVSDTIQRTDADTIDAWIARAREDIRPMRLAEVDESEPHNLALCLFLGIVGGLGYASAGALGAGPWELYL